MDAMVMTVRAQDARSAMYRMISAGTCWSPPDQGSLARRRARINNAGQLGCSRIRHQDAGPHSGHVHPV